MMSERDCLPIEAEAEAEAKDRIHEHFAKVIQLYKMGYTPRRIAWQVGRSRAQVRKELRYARKMCLLD